MQICTRVESQCVSSMHLLKCGLACLAVRKYTPRKLFIVRQQVQGKSRMSDHKDRQRSEADANLEREIREGRKFTLAEAIARLAGPGAMKGESPVTRMQQAEFEIETCLRCHLADAGGGLEVVLNRRVKGSELLLNNFDQPLVVLASYCQRVLSSAYLLKEVVRDADVEWGRVMGERPYLEKKDSPCDPDDPYTDKSVHLALSELLRQLDVVVTHT